MIDYLALIERHAAVLCAARFTRNQAHNSQMTTNSKTGQQSCHRPNFCEECRDIATTVHDDVYRLVLL